MILLNLWMHRTGVFGGARNWFGLTMMMVVAFMSGRPMMLA